MLAAASPWPFTTTTGFVLQRPPCLPRAKRSFLVALVVWAVIFATLRSNQPHGVPHGTTTPPRISMAMEEEIGAPTRPSSWQRALRGPTEGRDGDEEDNSTPSIQPPPGSPPAAAADEDASIMSMPTGFRARDQLTAIQSQLSTKTTSLTWYGLSPLCRGYLYRGGMRAKAAWGTTNPDSWLVDDKAIIATLVALPAN